MKYGIPMILPVVIERVLWILLGVYDSLKSRMMCWLWGIEGRHVRFIGKALIRVHHKGDVRIGDGTVFNSRFSTNPVGLVNPTFLDTRAGGKIVIGANSGLSSVIISSKSSIAIGSNVKIGGNVKIFDHDFHSLAWQDRRSPENRSSVRANPVVIGDDVFIGTNAIILKGSHIGERSIVAAGSVVFGLDAPADSLIKGNPAFVVRRDVK